MSETPTTQPEAAGSTTEIQHDRLALLKAKADKLGLQYHPSIGVEALSEKLKTHEEALDRAAEEKLRAAQAAIQASQPQPQAQTQVVVRQETADDRAAAQRARKASKYNSQRKSQLRLIRCRITNLNPAKRDLSGEVFTVANGILGAVSKYVPYNEAGQSYHLPQILVTMLRDRKYMQLRRRPGKFGIDMVERRLVPEFNIEELEPLSVEELRRLANVQAAGHNIDP